MKRIAILTHHFHGATLPLAKQFVEEGMAVDYYLLCGDTVSIRESVNFKSMKAKRFIGVVNYECCPDLYDYYGSCNIRFFYHRCPRPFKHIPLIRSVAAVFLFFYDFIFCQCINRKKYDAVLLIGTYVSDDYINLLRFLVGKIVVSLHEVIPDLLNKLTAKPSPLMRKVFSSNCKIVVHSKNTLKDLKVLDSNIEERIKLIHFGKFETYRLLETKDSIIDNLPQKYILFFGRIVPYKGLDLLYKAVIDNRQILSGYKIVVAGEGSVDCLDTIKNDDSFICINRRLTNEELATLIKNSMFIVCPYRGISQSGIPQTSFVFNKPIVCTRLDAFSEVMTEGHECLMFETENSKDLGEKLNEMIRDYPKYEKNIISFESHHPDYSWAYIKKQYIALFDII